jgi:hypothetical protein
MWSGVVFFFSYPYQICRGLAQEDHCNASLVSVTGVCCCCLLLTIAACTHAGHSSFPTCITYILHFLTFPTHPPTLRLYQNTLPDTKIAGMDTYVKRSTKGTRPPLPSRCTGHKKCGCIPVVLYSLHTPCGRHSRSEQDLEFWLW